jgi:hypothetical protein
MARLLLPAWFLVLALSAAGASGADVEIRLGLANAHVVEVFLGWHAEGTEGYDRGLDDFAPPPGIDTGYAGFLPKAKLPLLYRDIRSPKGPHEWSLLVRPARDRPVEVSWDPKALPAGWTFTLVHGKRTVSMADQAAVAVAESATVTLRAAVLPDVTP